MMEIKTTEHQRYRAFLDAARLGPLNKHAISTEHNDIGMLAEEVFQSLYPEAVRVSFESFDYDFVLKGKRVDVKARSVSVEPKPYFDHVVTKTKEFDESKVDFFYFFAVDKSFLRVWDMGFLSSREFGALPLIPAKQDMPQGGAYRCEGRRVLYNNLRQREPNTVITNVAQRVRKTL